MGVSCPQYIASIYPVATEHEKHIWMPSPFPLWMVLGPLVHTCPGATKHGTEQQAINPTVYNQYILSSVAKCPQAKQPEHPRDCTGICPGDSKGSKVNIRGAICCRLSVSSPGPDLCAQQVVVWAHWVQAPICLSICCAHPNGLLTLLWAQFCD
jgi:hypothetical protein